MHFYVCFSSFIHVLIQTQFLSGAHLCFQSVKTEHQSHQESEASHLMCHLQWLASFNEDSILSSDPRAHHDGSRGCQPQRAGAGDGENSDGCLEGEANDNLRLGDVLVVTLRGGQPCNNVQTAFIHMQK